MKITRCHTLFLFLLVNCVFPHFIVAADKLRIGYGAPSVAMAVLWITKEGRLFEKNGLDVEVLYLESALVQRALIAGNSLRRDDRFVDGGAEAARRRSNYGRRLLESAYLPPGRAAGNQSNS